MGDIIIMSRKEKRCISIFEQLKRREITQGEAGQILNLSERQIRRKIKRYLKHGLRGLPHKNRGRPGNRKTPEEKRNKIIELYKSHFHDFGPTFATEKMQAMFHTAVHPETLRLWLIRENLWTKKRKRSKHKKWRERRKNPGELVQVDGSYHLWFEDRNKEHCMVAFIDDATNEIWCRFTKNESYTSMIEVTSEYCLEKGKPVELYSDRGGVYKVNKGNPDGDKKTHYELGLKALDIGIIHANTPQAKGRVERLFNTLQDRLVKELRLRGISDADSANCFLKSEFIDAYNKKYSVEPANKNSFYKKTSKEELYKAFCIREKRVLQNDYTIRYKNQRFQLHEEQKTIIRPKNKITIHEYLDGKIELFIRNTELYFDNITDKVLKSTIKPRKYDYETMKNCIPAKDHPWRKTNGMFYR